MSFFARGGGAVIALTTPVGRGTLKLQVRDFPGAKPGRHKLTGVRLPAAAVLMHRQRAQRRRERPPIAPIQLKASRRNEPSSDKYGVGCHNDRAKTGGLTLQQINARQRPRPPTEVWEQVIRKLRTE